MPDYALNHYRLFSTGSLIDRTATNTYHFPVDQTSQPGWQTTLASVAQTASRIILFPVGDELNAHMSQHRHCLLAMWPDKRRIYLFSHRYAANVYGLKTDMIFVAHGQSPILEIIDYHTGGKYR